MYRVNMRMVTYWFGAFDKLSASSPKNGMLLHENGSWWPVDFTKHWLSDEIRKVPAIEWKAFLLFSKKGAYAEWKNEFGSSQYLEMKKNEESDAFAVRIFEAQSKEEAEIQKREADPVRKLEWLLKRHDWTYMFSDDHRYWASGDASWKQITDLRIVVGDKVWTKLVKKYQPKEVA
jgi:hypothetical protein